MTPSRNTASSELAPDDYDLVRRFLREQIGYELGEGKEYLVENRLAPIAASFDLPDVRQLIARLRQTSDCQVRQAVIEGMTINETYFFRGPRLFRTLTDTMIPRLLRARPGGRIRIWLAACSTGQEAYSVAMSLTERFGAITSTSFELIATDVSDRALEQARQGIYNQFEVQRGLPIHSLLKHFTKQNDHWKIRDALRSLIQFRKHNLLDSFLTLGGTFDIIFLRNVLIYFDTPAKSVLFARVRQAIAPDGYLVLGDAESVLGLTQHFVLPTDHRDFFVPALS